MQEEDNSHLSCKSKGILSHLKKSLVKRKQTLEELIIKIFRYKQTKYNKKQFQKIIKFYDPNLMYDEIDQLFEELDINNNGCIFYEQLLSSYQKVQEKYLTKKMNETLKSKIRMQKQSQIELLTKFRNSLLNCQNYLSAIDLFDTGHQGFLTHENMIQIIKAFQFQSKYFISYMIEQFFQGNQLITVDKFIEKLGLKEEGKRMNLSDLKIQESIILQDNLSEYIIEQQTKKSRIIMEESIPIERSTSDVSKYKISEIPAILQPYFNYSCEFMDKSFSKIAQQYLKNNLVFIDTNNPSYSDAHQWVHLAEGNQKGYFLFQVAQSVIKRQINRKGLGLFLESKDIMQGSLGDCYFLSAIAGVVEIYPQLMDRLFILEKNPSHLYGVQLFIDGIWITLALDVCFPVTKYGRFCGAQPHHQEIWVMLLEKAWAKCYGSYDNIHSGFNQEGLNALSGAPSIHLSSGEKNFVKSVQKQIQKGSVLTCATSADVRQMTSKQQQKFGIYSNHAYSLMDIFTDIPYNETTITLLKIRNPWGKKQWRGAWSFSSKQWKDNDEIRNLLNYDQNCRNDGVFYMDMTHFLIYFNHVNVCRINLQNVNSWISITCQRQTFAQCRFSVNTEGVYYFTIYQENARKYKNSSNYEISTSWLFLCREESKNNIFAIGSSSKHKTNNTLEVTLRKGNYIVISRVDWKYWESYTYNLTSYGPSKISFKSEKFNYDVLNKFIQDRSLLHLGTKKQYEKLNIFQTVYFSPEEGYGFICIHNQQNRLFQVTINMNPCQGIQLLQPHKFPLILHVVPLEIAFGTFLVGPRGFRYNLIEKYMFVPNY